MGGMYASQLSALGSGEDDESRRHGNPALMQMQTGLGPRDSAARDSIAPPARRCS